MRSLLLVEIVTALSVFGSCFTILSYCLFAELRSTSKIYVVWLAVGSLGYSTVTFLRYDSDNPDTCVATAIIESYFSLVTLFTTVVIANCIRLIFSSFNSHHHARIVKFSIAPWHYIFVWVVPIILALLPLSTDSYGKNKTDKYCWIKTDTGNHSKNHVGYLWEGVILYFLVVVAIGFNVYIYATVILKVNKWKGSDRASCRVRGVVKRMAAYPLILTAVYLFPFIHRILEVANIQPFWLVLTSAATLKSQGLLDSIAYGLTPAVIDKWKALFNELMTKYVYDSSWCDNDTLEGSQDSPITNFRGSVGSDTGGHISSPVYGSVRDSSVDDGSIPLASMLPISNPLADDDNDDAGSSAMVVDKYKNGMSSETNGKGGTASRTAAVEGDVELGLACHMQQWSVGVGMGTPSSFVSPITFSSGNDEGYYDY